MGANVFNVRYSAGPRLAAGEAYFPWDEDCWGTVAFEQDAIRLSGKHKMGVAGNLLTLGPAQSLLKGAVARDVAEVVPVSDLSRAVIRKTKAQGESGAFRLYQKRDDGTVTVHSFVVGLMARKGERAIDDAITALTTVVPASILEYEGAARPVVVAPAADWYPDPSGSHQFRYWDGAQWTAQVADDGQQSVDPLRVGG